MPRSSLLKFLNPKLVATAVNTPIKPTLQEVQK